MGDFNIWFLMSCKYFYHTLVLFLANLKNHIGVNHKETNIFACKVCEFNSNSKEALKVHEKTHSGK